MFRQRTSSQKPGDELLANFRERFPNLSGVTTGATVPGETVTALDTPGPITASPESRSQSLGHEAFRDQDPTPRAQHEAWRFTPSLLDPNSFSFSTFANQPPGYYTPTPGGTNTLYHPQAGDLHTPTLSLGMGLGTPLSMPTTEGGQAALHHSGQTMMDMAHFHALQPQHFHPYNPFIQPPPQQPSFAPSSFVHQDTGYETMDQDGSPMDSDAAEERMAAISASFQGGRLMGASGFQPRVQFGIPMTSGLPASAERFRFHSTLNAPTAMIKSADEIPVTYLNKGQAYSLSVVDTHARVPLPRGTRYRTFVRISFEDEQQRRKPGVCWSLWKEGRGTNEAHQRGGKLQAVEFVESPQPAEGDDKRTRIELETASFDGFSVVWTPGANAGAAECNVAVRFNFLSTDFSHSKGVKGIPVRLCAKTTRFTTSDDAASPTSSGAPAPANMDSQTAGEICYCKVKLFRDHGAERKLSNDVAHVKKTIDKLKQQIAQAESGLKDFGKRKRGSVAAQAAKVAAAASGGVDSQRGVGKVQKHKRTWSMSSASSAGGGTGNTSGSGDGRRLPLEEDLHFKLQTLQDMFTSTRPVSVLYLRGEDGDDPDAHPVSLPGEPLDLTKVDSAQSGRSSVGGGSSLVSPSPSSMSLHSQVSGANTQWQDFQSVGAAAGAAAAAAAATAAAASADPTAKVARRSSADQPTRVAALSPVSAVGSSKPPAAPGGSDDKTLSGWIEALGVDPTYRPPPEPAQKPVACFYILRRQLGASNSSSPPDSDGRREYHRAIYLMERSLGEFVNRVAAKWGLDPNRAVRTVHVLSRGLETEMDDDVIRELAEGQDMLLDIAEADGGIKQDWEMAIDDAAASPPVVQGGYELRLTF